MYEFDNYSNYYEIPDRLGYGYNQGGEYFIPDSQGSDYRPVGADYRYESGLDYRNNPDWRDRYNSAGGQRWSSGEVIDQFGNRSSGRFASNDFILPKGQLQGGVENTGMLKGPALFPKQDPSFSLEHLERRIGELSRLTHPNNIKPDLTPQEQAVIGRDRLELGKLLEQRNYLQSLGIADGSDGTTRMPREQVMKDWRTNVGPPPMQDMVGEKITFKLPGSDSQASRLVNRKIENITVDPEIARQWGMQASYGKPGVAAAGTVSRQPSNHFQPPASNLQAGSFVGADGKVVAVPTAGHVTPGMYNRLSQYTLGKTDAPALVDEAAENTRTQDQWFDNERNTLLRRMENTLNGPGSDEIKQNVARYVEEKLAVLDQFQTPSQAGGSDNGDALKMTNDAANYERINQQLKEKYGITPEVFPPLAGAKKGVESYSPIGQGGPGSEGAGVSGGRSGSRGVSLDPWKMMSNMVDDNIRAAYKDAILAAEKKKNWGKVQQLKDELHGLRGESLARGKERAVSAGIRGGGAGITTPEKTEPVSQKGASFFDKVKDVFLHGPPRPDNPPTVIGYRLTEEDRIPGLPLPRQTGIYSPHKKPSEADIETFIREKLKRERIGEESKKNAQENAEKLAKGAALGWSAVAAPFVSLHSAMLNHGTRDVLQNKLKQMEIYNRYVAGEYNDIDPGRKANIEKYIRDLRYKFHNHPIPKKYIREIEKEIQRLPGYLETVYERGGYKDIFNGPDYLKKRDVRLTRPGEAMRNFWQQTNPTAEATLPTAEIWLADFMEGFFDPRTYATGGVLGKVLNKVVPPIAAAVHRKLAEKAPLALTDVKYLNRLIDLWKTYKVNKNFTGDMLPTEAARVEAAMQYLNDVYKAMNRKAIPLEANVPIITDTRNKAKGAFDILSDWWWKTPGQKGPGVNIPLLATPWKNPTLLTPGGRIPTKAFPAPGGAGAMKALPAPGGKGVVKALPAPGGTGSGSLAQAMELVRREMFPPVKALPWGGGSPGTALTLAQKMGLWKTPLDSLQKFILQGNPVRLLQLPLSVAPILDKYGIKYTPVMNGPSTGIVKLSSEAARQLQKVAENAKTGVRKGQPGNKGTPAHPGQPVKPAAAGVGLKPGVPATVTGVPQTPGITEGSGRPGFPVKSPGRIVTPEVTSGRPGTKGEPSVVPVRQGEPGKPDVQEMPGVQPEEPHVHQHPGAYMPGYAAPGEIPENNSLFPGRSSLSLSRGYWPPLPQGEANVPLPSSSSGAPLYPMSSNIPERLIPNGISEADYAGSVPFHGLAGIPGKGGSKSTSGREITDEKRLIRQPETTKSTHSGRGREIPRTDRSQIKRNVRNNPADDNQRSGVMPGNQHIEAGEVAGRGNLSTPRGRGITYAGFEYFPTVRRHLESVQNSLFGFTGGYSGLQKLTYELLSEAQIQQLPAKMQIALRIANAYSDEQANKIVFVEGGVINRETLVHELTHNAEQHLPEGGKPTKATGLYGEAVQAAVSLSKKAIAAGTFMRDPRLRVLEEFIEDNVGSSHFQRMLSIVIQNDLINIKYFMNMMNKGLLTNIDHQFAVLGIHLALAQKFGYTIEPYEAPGLIFNIYSETLAHYAASNRAFAERLFGEAAKKIKGP